MSLLPDDDGPAPTVYAGPSGITQANPLSPPAPLSASYVVLSADSTLLGERVLTPGLNLSLSDGGAGGQALMEMRPDHIDLPGQSGTVAPVTIITAAAAGLYLLMATVDVTGAAAAGALSAEANYTNGGAKVATALLGLTLSALGLAGGSIPFHHTGGDITVSATATGLVGVPAFDVAFRIFRLG